MTPSINQMTMTELLDLLTRADNVLRPINRDHPADGLNHQVAFIVREAVSAVERARVMVERSLP
jgi:hypothetical protein